MPLTRRECLGCIGAAGAAAMLPGCAAGTGREARHVDTFCFAVVSDTHLGKEPATIPQAGAADPSRLMAAAVAEINASPAAATVFLGDLVDTGQENEGRYEEWMEIARRLKKPFHAVPGNHDPAPFFLKYVHAETDYAADYGLWRFVFFQDTTTDSHNGTVTAAQIEWVARQVDAAAGAGRRAILFSHVTRHPNSEPDWGWYIRSHEDEFRQMLEARRGKAVAFLSGHLHCGLRGWSDTAGVHEAVMPAASWNFEKDLRQAPGFSLPQRRPGWVLAELRAGGLSLCYKPLGGEALEPLVLAFPAV